jgi:hypothetical protein
MVTVQLEAVKRERRGGGPVWARSRRSRVLPAGAAEICLLWVQRCGRRRGDGQRTAGSRKTRVEGQGAGLGAIASISSSICGTCGNPPAVGAGDVGGEGGMVSVQLEAVKREWRARGPVWARSRRSRVLSAGPAEIRLLWVQEMREEKGGWSAYSWKP